MARLEVLYRDQLVGEFRLGPGKAIIGRTSDNDVQIQSRFISRHHAQVVSDQTHSILEDLNSTNGVFIRSQRVKHQTLVDGDVIQIGEHKLLYRDMRHAGGQALIAEDDDELDELEEDEEDEDEAGDDADELEEEELDERER
jgi:pSer/pThr/pTyr-binding forkhead associated (FHA) protein